MHRVGVAGLLMMAVICGAPAGAFAQAVAKGKNDVTGSIFIVTSKPTADDSERFNRIDFSASYARFVTDRVAVGPLFRVDKSNNGDDATGYIGALGRYFIGGLDKRAIPYVEVNSSKTINGASGQTADLQLVAGVMIPMGKTGGRFRVSPYYYRGFYDEDVAGITSFNSFGVSWSIGLLF